ncbi:hypothetical protein N9847_01300 [bacterium]|nr:hypothetical protein [bacterium]
MTQKQMNLAVIMIGLIAGGYGVYRLFYAKPYILLGCFALVPGMMVFAYWNHQYPFREGDTGDDLFNMVARLLLAAGVIAGFLGLGIGGGECNNRYC